MLYLHLRRCPKSGDNTDLAPWVVINGVQTFLPRVPERGDDGHIVIPRPFGLRRAALHRHLLHSQDDDPRIFRNALPWI
jgi:hypothetical protein